ncbi:MAG: hypothetical protein AMXMBFR23_25840 [Chloroflexota bacterium]
METLALVLIAFGGTLIQAGVGFGFALVFVPIAALVVPPREAVAVSLLLGTVLASGMYLEHPARTSGRAIAPLVVGAVAGTPIGLVALLRADETVLRFLVASTVLASALVTLATGHSRPHAARPEPLLRQGLAGLLGGIIRGAVSMGGPPIVIYQHWIGGSAERIRNALTAYFFWLGIPATLIALPTGVFTRDVVRTVAFALPALVAGMAVGRYVRPRLPEAWFGAISMLVLAATAAVAAWGAAASLLG